MFCKECLCTSRNEIFSCFVTAYQAKRRSFLEMYDVSMTGCLLMSGQRYPMQHMRCTSHWGGRGRRNTLNASLPCPVSGCVTSEGFRVFSFLDLDLITESPDSGPESTRGLCRGWLRSCSSSTDEGCLYNFCSPPCHCQDRRDQTPV